MNTLIDQVANISNVEGISTLPGMENLEKWTAKNLLNSLVSQEGLSLNIDTSFIDTATAGVSKKLDTALQ
jgi:hypothetical protein